MIINPVLASLEYFVPMALYPEAIDRISTQAQKNINHLLADVWGVEFVEPENILIEDEQEY